MLISKSFLTLISLLFLMPVLHPSASLEWRPVQFDKVQTVGELVKASDLIAVGTLEPSYQSHSLHKQINSYELMNFKQHFNISTTWKGSAGTQVTLLSTGLNPLPKPRSPLNLTYPGDLTKGRYVLFLKHVEGTPFYQLTTGMQSVYPIRDGQTISFVDAGFPELNQLTLDTFRKKLKNERTR